MTCLGNTTGSQGLPGWVPEAACNYLAHTEGGISIRAVARQRDVHPSTVLRQVRRFESRRDDPLVDAALQDLSAQVARNARALRAKADQVTERHVTQEAKRVLRRLAEPHAVLAVALEMETAVVVRQSDDGGQVRTATVTRDIAQALALKEWITCAEPDARIVRYTITNAGRAEFRRLMAMDENRAAAQGAGEALAEEDWDTIDLASVGRSMARQCASESPLVALSRRRSSSGDPFLTRELVAVGERLREDFELVDLGRHGLQEWQALLSGAPTKLESVSQGAQAALDRVKAALQDLGPGLGDVALRCCCFLEGLEHTEKAMGWSARSGKIVLRIALERLKRHYAQTYGQFGPMIG
ncbi:DUF6456 domain-containing protein [Yoonia litorea]|uniref:DUF6456 domain-containing protein n=1 Tax=Yoonia litorea TaxID=1123755 RepID=A0A1I6M2G9_9RHOB|nr:DUF6456 domain-containing protein [Yoonia litorea]SFS09873.1 hypothetical protein SAMN05444714_1160 [Yoonia litorea]